jgi:beta-N-acetylhexosaminidase
MVSKMGLATIAGLQDNGVVACGKHFPGHGDTELDSHHELPIVKQPAERLQEVELRPFIHAIDNRLAAIMTAHVVYTALDPAQPATLSHPILTGLLRNQLRFSGLIVTDDLLMGAIAARLGPGEASVETLRAGADVALFGTGPGCAEEAYSAIEKGLRQGRLAEDRLDQAVLRVLSTKEKFVLPYAPADPKRLRETVGAPAHRRFLRELTETAAPPAARL